MSSSSPIKRIAISTGGGDAPGLDAVIRAAALSALNRGWECYGMRDSWNGLLLAGQYVEGGLVRLMRGRVRGITYLGGTIMGTTNRNNPMQYPIQDKGGNIQEVDRSDDLVRNFMLHHTDAVITIGGGR